MNNTRALAANTSSRFAQCGLAVMMLGLVTTAILWVFVPDFWFVVPAALASQAVGLLLGVLGWQSITGKVVAAVSGVLLMLFILFFAFVMLLVLSAQYGAPM